MIVQVKLQRFDPVNERLALVFCIDKPISRGQGGRILSMNTVLVAENVDFPVIEYDSDNRRQLFYKTLIAASFQTIVLVSGYENWKYRGTSNGLGPDKLFRSGCRSRFGSSWRKRKLATEWV